MSLIELESVSAWLNGEDKQLLEDRLKEVIILILIFCSMLHTETVLPRIICQLYHYHYLSNCCPAAGCG